MTVTVETVRRRLAHIDASAKLSALGRDEFEGYASLFGVPDGAGDVVAPGAFTASLKKRGLARIRMLYQHFAHEPIGVWEDIHEDARGLYVKGRLVTDTQRGREVEALLRQGALNGLSIGFRTQRARRDAGTGLRTLLEVELWEISVVTFPLLTGSQVTAIGAKSNEAASAMRKAATALHTSSVSSPARPKAEGREPRNRTPRGVEHLGSLPLASLGRE